MQMHENESKLQEKLEALEEKLNKLMNNNSLAEGRFFKSGSIMYTGDIEMDENLNRGSSAANMPFMKKSSRAKLSGNGGDHKASGNGVKK